MSLAACFFVHDCNLSLEAATYWLKRGRCGLVSNVMTFEGPRAARAAGVADELVARAREGDGDAFRAIFDRYSKPVTSFLCDLVGDRGLAEELAQETFVRAYKALGSFREDGRVSTWIFGIAKNVARESHRSRRRESSRVALDDEGVVELSDAAPLPEHQLLGKEFTRLVHDALGALDDDKRTVFALKVFQQKSYEEISEITGSSVPKLKTDLHRAKAEIRRRIRPYLGVSDGM